MGLIAALLTIIMISLTGVLVFSLIMLIKQSVIDNFTHTAKETSSNNQRTGLNYAQEAISIETKDIDSTSANPIEEKNNDIDVSSLNNIINTDDNSIDTVGPEENVNGITDETYVSVSYDNQHKTEVVEVPEEAKGQEEFGEQDSTGTGRQKGNINKSNNRKNKRK
ncbi:MAG: hypothetical protein ACOYWZ_12885 [Bacillota bacterium]